MSSTDFSVPNKSDIATDDAPTGYDDEVTDQDIAALEKHVAEHFGPIEDYVLVSGPAW